MRDNTIIKLENISRTYDIGETEVRALESINLSVAEGEIMAIMGPSGSGKSTLMNILGCLDQPTQGKYFLDGQEVSKMDKNRLALVRNKKIGFVFQSFNLLSRTTALENTELPLLYSHDVPHKQHRDLAKKALKMVGLEGRELHKTNQLSGGEQQRVAIARSLVNNPALLLADEPTGNLDSKTGEEIMRIFNALNKQQNITVILVTHDPDVAALARRSIHLKDGRIIKEMKS
ncbi:MAG: macrolide ABC transporter ATP-binding protein [Candidatus Aminicenantes bacterium RBG_13_62_12]|nr:MAG: macrolide ABC transporter ATP-binding protein [Candidatus Aminicenantes bacterium RBG_13_62_12]